MIKDDMLNKRYKIVIVCSSIFLILFLYLILFYKHNNYNYNIKSYISKNTIDSKITSNTLRIEGKNLYDACRAISETSYPSTLDYNRPNAVILVRDDKITEGILAARMCNDPIDAPILFTKKENIPESTLKEIERLKPRGISEDKNTKVILLGDIGEGVERILNDKGLRYINIQGKDIYELSFNIDNYLSALNGNHKDNVIIAPIEKPEYALQQLSWSSYKGDGFFFIEKDKIPEAVKKALKARQGGAYIYILGNDLHVSSKVQGELSKYGHVEKIPQGEDIYNQVVGFNRYKDLGKNFSWWFSKQQREFGFGITKPGNSFIFVNPKDWQVAVASTALCHKGKYSSILFINKNNIPYAVESYLKNIRPTYNCPQEHLNNHGFIVGDSNSISDSTQVEIDRILEYKEVNNNGI
ncbi:cell wall-binding repeat-containing protein [Clostridium niameyense]|uniref:Cell wall-binding repeat-containing protein n=1 Tax=Clostridium niameyense TaxID=1622073 RepID=A0A6M0RA45_9CLOT|nr:cell wall-binding repeat-containing protein [Clostridium niameyense]NEZ46469.1 cell wall-binding repeat-containing protein [Clostridium niameyense]